MRKFLFNTFSNILTKLYEKTIQIAVLLFSNSLYSAKHYVKRILKCGKNSADEIETFS